jgi:hypothetical protein
LKQKRSALAEQIQAVNFRVVQAKKGLRTSLIAVPICAAFTIYGVKHWDNKDAGVGTALLGGTFGAVALGYIPVNIKKIKAAKQERTKLLKELTTLDEQIKSLRE